MKKLFIGNLPSDTTETSVQDLFSEFGTVRSINLVADMFTGKCRGFCFIEMEGHEARAAKDALDGKSFGGNSIRVRFEDPQASRGRKGR